jgi:hypothetical protein
MNKHLEEVVTTYLDGIRLELKQRWEGWPLDFGNNTVHEVVGALLARQTTLASNFAVSPGNWTDHLAPLVFRAMADVHISLAWILVSPKERTNQFVRYGLGQAKLEIEHRKAQMERDGKDSKTDELIDKMEHWVNAQRYMYLVEVDLGAWSDLTTRRMAEEASLLDFYNYVYTPFSACVHSTWQHVGRLNLQPCFSPLHGGHQIPWLPDFEVEPHYLYLVAKYLHKSFLLFDEKIGPSCPGPEAFGKLAEGLAQLGSKADPNNQMPSGE